MAIVPKDPTFDELEKRVKKYLKYDLILDNLILIFLGLLMGPLFLGIVVTGSLGIELAESWQAVIMVSGFSLSLVLYKWTRKKTEQYEVKSGEWARFYTRSIYINLENYLHTESSGMKKEYRKRALKDAKSFLLCIEKKWKVGSFEPVRRYVGDSISNLKKNIRWRVIPAIKDGDDELVNKVRSIMYNFLSFSKALSINNINELNDQMSKTEGTILPKREPLRKGYLARVSMFLETRRILKHSFAILGFFVICVVLGHVGITYFGIAKEYAWTGSIALFVGLFATYFSRQPKIEE